MRRFADKPDSVLTDRFENDNEEQNDDNTEDKSEKEDEGPEFPYTEHNTITVEHDIIEATIHYKNGDVETIESYGEYERDENHIDIIIDKTLDCSVGSWTKYNPTSEQTDLRTIHPTYLSRDVEYEKVATEIWEIETEKKVYEDSRGFTETKCKIESFSSYRPVDKYE
jgi:hypothetical protein